MDDTHEVAEVQFPHRRVVTARPNQSFVDAVRIAVKDAPRVPVVALEWLDPVFIAGHWTPQLIEWAGGIDVLGFAGEPSEQLGGDGGATR